MGIMAKRRQAFKEAASKGMFHATFDPNGPDSVRLFLIPPKKNPYKSTWFMSINGQVIFPIGHAWAWMMKNFIEILSEFFGFGHEISESELIWIKAETVRRIQELYPKTTAEVLIDDLEEVLAIVYALANNEPLPENFINEWSIKEYAERMGAPHRLDLIVSAMTVGGKYNCPNTCPRICYAHKQPIMNVEEELSTKQWIEILDTCWQIGVPQITFTGGEPLMRKDIVDLVWSAHEHFTRINTNGRPLVLELAKKLAAVSLDNIQITLYSHNPQVHDRIVGSKGAWAETIQGIENALEAGLSLSVNTPLVTSNSDYVTTLRFLQGKGVRYVTCSGLLPAGAATQSIDSGRALNESQLFGILQEAVRFCKETDMNIEFTSPGWVSADKLHDLGLNDPICGAGLSNMAIGPSGEVLPCQSWLHQKGGLGNILTTPWSEIWNTKKTKDLRNIEPDGCPLKEVK
jgi:MoaA/NifB/PqqE/SkfB family radical SAM enzyme